MILIGAVCGALYGLFAAGIGGLMGAPSWAIYLLGFTVGIAHLGFTAWLGGRRYFAVWRTITPISPSPPPDAAR